MTVRARIAAAIVITIIGVILWIGVIALKNKAWDECRINNSFGFCFSIVWIR